MRGMKYVVLAILAAALLVGCGAKPASIDVEPGSVTLKSAGATHTLTATVKDAKGQAIEKHEPIVWSSSDAEVAEVSATGVVKAKSSGKADVTAAAGEVTATVSVTVRIIAEVDVHPGKAIIEVGDSKNFDATVKDDKGKVVTGEKVKWSIGDGSVASVNDSGVVKGKSKGDTTVRASVESVSGKAEVTVKDKDEKKVELKEDVKDKKLDKGGKDKKELKPKLKEGAGDKKLKK